MDAADPSRWREEIEKSRALHAGSKEESDGVGRLLGMIDDLKMFGQEPVAGPDGPCISIPEVSCAPALTRPEVSCAPAPAPRAPTRPEASCAPAPAPASTRLEVVPNHPAATSDGESANKVEIRTASADELTTPSDNNLPSSNKEKGKLVHLRSESLSDIFQLRTAITVRIPIRLVTAIIRVRLRSKDHLVQPTERGSLRMRPTTKKPLVNRAKPRNTGN